jgi:transcriptional regulator with XRE-family HTH domain
MTPTTYGKIEKGRHTHTRKLQHIADVLGVPIELVLSEHPGIAPPLTVQETIERLAAEAIQKRLTQDALPTVPQKVKELSQYTQAVEHQRMQPQAHKGKKTTGRKK